MSDYPLKTCRICGNNGATEHELAEIDADGAGAFVPFCEYCVRILGDDSSTWIDHQGWDSLVRIVRRLLDSHYPERIFGRGLLSVDPGPRFIRAIRSALGILDGTDLATLWDDAELERATR